MNYLEKTFNFHGDELLTFLEEATNKLYIGIAYICNSLGMTEDQKRNQVKKVQEEETLKSGVKKLSVKIDTQVREQIFIELDYLPIWLAKINPSRFNDELKNKLLDYQLHCKDILADEFLGRRELKLPGREENANVTDIKYRADRIDRSKQQISELLIQIAYDSHFIQNSAGILEREAKAGYKNLSNDKYLVDGKLPTVEDIDAVNEDTRNRVIENLKE